MNELTLLLIIGFCVALTLVGILFWIAHMQQRHHGDGSYEYVQFLEGDVVYTGGFFLQEERIALSDIQHVSFAIDWGRFRFQHKTYLGHMKIVLKSSPKPVEWNFESSLYYGHYVDSSTQRDIYLTTNMLMEQFAQAGIACEKDQSFIGWG